jgi:hypothetical protein
MGLFTTNLRGKSLTRLLGVVGALAFTLQGYDQAVANGLLTMSSFIKVFPQIDTSSPSLIDSQKSHNSTIQGQCAFEVGFCNWLTLDPRYDRSTLRSRRSVGSIIMCIPWRLVGTAQDGFRCRSNLYCWDHHTSFAIQSGPTYCGSNYHWYATLS